MYTVYLIIALGHRDIETGQIYPATGPCKAHNRITLTTEDMVAKEFPSIEVEREKILPNEVSDVTRRGVVMSLPSPGQACRLQS